MATSNMDTELKYSSESGDSSKERTFLGSFLLSVRNQINAWVSNSIRIEIRLYRPV